MTPWHTGTPPLAEPAPPVFPIPTKKLVLMPPETWDDMTAEAVQDIRASAIETLRDLSQPVVILPPGWTMQLIDTAEIAGL